MPSNNIIELLGFCLHNTYFLFQGQFYEQTKGPAMGLPVRPIVANLYMKEFEHRAMTTTVNPPRHWKSYVDDTFVVQHHIHKEEFLEHINSVNPSIQFTMEEAISNGSMLFLDTTVIQQKDGTFTTGVYRKPHTLTYICRGVVIIIWHLNTM